jgi:EAL domain-containing protein (putative c-di-GMP-specific phosphodiesterase class I)
MESPIDLFAYARRMGADTMVDRACLETVLEHAGHLPGGTAVEVNVIATTLAFPSFRDFLTTLARRCSVSPSRLILDVSDYAAVWEDFDLPEALEHLRGVGARIAFDDKGLGDPNFEVLLKCCPDYLKLDRYLVHGAIADRSKRMVMRATCDLARKLHIRVIAEGIETQEDLDFVATLEIDLGQGYALSEPRTVAECVRLAARPEPGPAEISRRIASAR